MAACALSISVPRKLFVQLHMDSAQFPHQSRAEAPGMNWYGAYFIDAACALISADSAMYACWK